MGYALIHGQLDKPLDDFFEAPFGRDLRRHGSQERYRRFNRVRLGAAFSLRYPRSWNALPLKVVTAPTPGIFKRILADGWASLFPDMR